MYELYTDITFKLTSGRPDPARLLNCRTARLQWQYQQCACVLYRRRQLLKLHQLLRSHHRCSFYVYPLQAFKFVMNCPCSHDICSIMVQYTAKLLTSCCSKSGQTTHFFLLCFWQTAGKLTAAIPTSLWALNCKHASNHRAGTGALEHWAQWALCCAVLSASSWNRFVCHQHTVDTMCPLPPCAYKWVGLFVDIPRYL